MLESVQQCVVYGRGYFGARGVGCFRNWGSFEIGVSVYYEPYTLGSILGPLIFGNSQLESSYS